MKEIIDIYFKDIRKSQPFTYEQEQELAREIQGGSQAALDKLVKGNLRFVVTIAREYQGRGIELNDLIQEGNIGLIKAASKFDPEAGFRFVTYAVWWIRQQIFTALSESRLVRLPMNMVGVVNQINKAADLFRKVEEREPSDVELAALTGINVEDIRAVMPVSVRAASLSKPVGDEDDSELGDLIEDVDAAASDGVLAAESCTVDILRVLTMVLTEREAKVLIKVFGIGCEALSEEQAGKILDVSEERVRQIKNAALKKLKKSKKVLEVLRPYLG